MATRKRRSALTQCARCSLYVLTRDADTHAAAGCALAAADLFVRPTRALRASATRVESRAAHMPTDALGWSRHNTALVNADTLELLSVLPRAACVLTCGKTRHIVMVWPCSELSPLKIDVEAKVRAESVVTLHVVRGCVELAHLRLSATSGIAQRLLDAEHFAHYLRVYLAGAFVSPALPLDVDYLAQRLTFDVEENADAAAARLSRCTLAERDSGGSGDANDDACGDIVPVYSLDKFTLSVGEQLR